MNNLKSLLLMCFIVFITSCTTTVTVKSVPPGASAKFDRTGITAITDEKVTVESSLFKSQLKIAKEHITFDKEGFRAQKVSKELKKGEDNIISVELDKIDTFIDIKSSPVPVKLEFLSINDKEIVEHTSTTKENSQNKFPDNSVYILPEGWPKQFTTPIHLECTQDEAQQLMNSVKLMMHDVPDYVPTDDFLKLVNGGMNAPLKMGKANVFNITLKPRKRTITFSSNPKGVDVNFEREDIRDVCDINGNNCIPQVVLNIEFLGTTPFNKSVGRNGPLQDGTMLLFEKTGYISKKESFSKDKDSYFVKLNKQPPEN